MKQNAITPVVQEIVSQVSLFNGIKKKQLPTALQMMNAELRSYQKGEFFTAINKPFTRGGIVISGELEVSAITENYTKFVMGHFRRGQVFGIALAIDRLPQSPMQLSAVSDCQILALDPLPLTALNQPASSLQQRLMANLIKFISQKNYFLTTRMHTLMQKNIHDKLVVYFHSLPTAADGKKRLVLNQTQLAAYIGANRSAMVRELGKMKKTGELTIDDHRVGLNEATD